MCSQPAAYIVLSSWGHLIALNVLFGQSDAQPSGQCDGDLMVIVLVVSLSLGSSGMRLTSALCC